MQLSTSMKLFAPRIPKTKNQKSSPNRCVTDIILINAEILISVTVRHHNGDDGFRFSFVCV